MNAQAHNNGVITERRVIDMYRDDILDDFLQAVPQKTDFVNEIMDLLNNYVNRQESLYKEICGITDKKEIVRIVNSKNGDLSYVMARISNKIELPMDYFHNYLFVPRILTILQEEREKQNT